MQLRIFDNPVAFRDRTLEFLLEREAECCVELGIIDRLIAGSTTSSAGEVLERPRLWAVEDGVRVVAVAVQTIADRMIVSRGPDAAMDAIATQLKEMRWEGQFLLGVTPSIRELAGRYGKLIDVAPKWGIGMRTMELRCVIDPRPVAGRLRKCDENDFGQIAKWCVDFTHDIGEPDENGERMARSLLGDSRAFFWDDGGPAAMAAWAGPTPNGIRINFVYTPPDRRRKGYASNLVAALSRRMMDEGRKFCFLFTDEANPTSNHVYEGIGYREVCRNEKWEVRAAGG